MDLQVFSGKAEEQILAIEEAWASSRRPTFETLLCDAQVSALDDSKLNYLSWDEQYAFETYCDINGPKPYDLISCEHWVSLWFDEVESNFSDTARIYYLAGRMICALTSLLKHQDSGYIYQHMWTLDNLTRHLASEPDRWFKAISSSQLLVIEATCLLIDDWGASTGTVVPWDEDIRSSWQTIREFHAIRSIDNEHQNRVKGQRPTIKGDSDQIL